MGERNSGPFLAVLGFIFLIISIIIFLTIVFPIIILTPLLIFSFTTIFYGFYSANQVKLSAENKGIVLIIEGIIPVIFSIYAFADSRILNNQLNERSIVINNIKLLTFLPLILGGILIIIYGLSLVNAEMEQDSVKLKKQTSQLLRKISIAIHYVNIIFFILLSIIIIAFLSYGP